MKRRNKQQKLREAGNNRRVTGKTAKRNPESSSAAAGSTQTRREKGELRGKREGHEDTKKKLGFHFQ